MKRSHSHAGSWYSGDPRSLRDFVSSVLSMPQVIKTPKALIGPHAGYSYSGETAGKAYSHLLANTFQPSSVVILGPSHHVSFSGCKLSPCSVLRTPLGDLKVDQPVISDLMQKFPKLFSLLSLSQDEDEHSIEMHLPFLAATVPQASVIPILVGSLSSPSLEAAYAEALLDLWLDPNVLFVVSSDFCHFGSRFGYVPLPSDSSIPLHKHIESLDVQGMQIIASKSGSSWRNYLKETGNTVCGRNPISLLLALIELGSKSGGKNSFDCTVTWEGYTQSSWATSANDSSVSYAAGLIFKS